jgi:hypothetical protein
MFRHLNSKDRNLELKEIVFFVEPFNSERPDDYPLFKVEVIRRIRPQKRSVESNMGCAYCRKALPGPRIVQIPVTAIKAIFDSHNRILWLNSDYYEVPDISVLWKKARLYNKLCLV